MASGLAPVSQKQFKVSIDGITAFFTSCTAPEESYESTEFNDGEQGQVLTHLGFLKLSNVTLAVNYDPVKHRALINWWKQYQKTKTLFTVSITPVNSDLEGSPISGASSLKLTGCQCMRFKYPASNREATGLAQLEMEVVPTAVSVS